MGGRDDGERSAMSRELVAKRRSLLNRVTRLVGSRVASWASGVEMRRWRAGTAAGGVIVADATIRSPLSFVRQSATSGTMPAPGDGAGLHHLLRGRPTEAGAAPISRARRVEAVDWNGSGKGAWGGVPAARPVTDLAALRQAEAEVEAKGPEIERGRSRERLQVDGLKRRRAKRSEMLMHLLSSASGLRHRCKESRRCKETLRYQNR